MLLLATPAGAESGGANLELPGSLGVGTVAAAVLARSIPADLGPSVAPVNRRSSACRMAHIALLHVLIAGITGGTVALRRRPLSVSGRSMKTPFAEIPAFKRVTPEKAVVTSLLSLEATSFYRRGETEEIGLKLDILRLCPCNP